MWHTWWLRARRIDAIKEAWASDLRKLRRDVLKADGGAAGEESEEDD